MATCQALCHALGAQQRARQMTSSPRGFMDTGSSQVQVDSCFSDCLRVIMGGKDTYRLLETVKIKMPQTVISWACSGPLDLHFNTLPKATLVSSQVLGPLT